MTLSDGRFFNVFRLKAKKKVPQMCVRDLVYTDDTGFVSHSEVDLQTILDTLAAASASFGLPINVRKIEVLHRPAPGTPYTAPTILLNVTPLNVATTFKYLGSTNTNDCSLDKELSARIQSASVSFGRLRERLLNKHNIKLVTKCKVYRAIILSCLLYSSEAYTLYRRHIQRLRHIHLRHLRAILGIKWSDRVTNNEVLQRADMPSIEAMLLSRQLTWTGHVARMNDNRRPKTVLCGELWQVKRNVGRRHLRYMDNATPPRRRYQQDAMGGDGALSQYMAYGVKRSRKSRNQNRN